MNVYIRTDLFNAGLTEDGQVYSAEMYYVVIEFPDGRRLAHNQRFYGAQRYAWCNEDGDGIFFEDLREEARAKVDALRDVVEHHLQNGGLINNDYWSEVSPAYGSKAYARDGGDQVENSSTDTLI